MGWLIYFTGSIVSMWVITRMMTVDFKEVTSKKVILLYSIMMFLGAVGSWFIAALVWFQREDIIALDNEEIKNRLFTVIGDDYEQEW